MLDNIRLLLDIQDLDLNIEEIESEREGLPARLNKIKASLREAEERLEDEKSCLNEMEKDMRHLEREIQSENDAIKKSEKKIPEIKTNKEYQALLKETSILKKKKEEMEERLLDFMEEVESNRLKVADSEKLFNEKLEVMKREEQRLNKEAKINEQRMNDLTNKRKVLITQIDEDLIRKYELMRSRGAGRAVVASVNGICGGCNMNIPPQIYNELISDDGIKLCPNCNRILYWEDK